MGKYLDWAKPYFEHKDCFKKEITEIKESESSLIIVKANYEDLVLEVGKDDLASHLGKDFSKFSSVWFIVDNSLSKVSDTILNWDILSSSPSFRIIFIELKSHKKWLLNPSIHAKITPEIILEKSLKSLRSNS